MNFNSLEFLIFLPVVAGLYWLLPHKFRWVLLLAASLFFYMSWNVWLIILIGITTVTAYVAAIAVSRAKSVKVKRIWLAATLVICLGILVFFKYINFLIESVVGVIRLFNAEQDDIVLNILLPVGISFYTFQTLSYVIDVYRGDYPAERHFGYFALYVTYFPQLVAGPIERPENLLPQLKEDHKLEASNAFFGLQKMAIGFFKKIVVADILAEFVNSVFNDAANATGLGVVLGAMLFAVQIYCDFSGYTDIAIGCARIMGIRLMQNFDLPYRARSIKEFWARWHISLSSWFRDYLYIPLGGNRCSRARNYFNVFVVFLVSGLWHGASWTFVLWGVLHGTYQIVGAMTKKTRLRLYEKMKIRTDSKVFAMGQRLVTFVLVCFAWIFFRANSTGDLWILIGKLFTAWDMEAISGTLSSMGFTVTAVLVTIFAILIMSMLDRMCDEPRLAENGTVTKQYTIAVITLAVTVAWSLLLSVGGASAFIYFQF